MPEYEFRSFNFTLYGLQVVRQMRRELRQKLEHDVKEFQENLQRDEDSAYFRQLEADRMRREFQLATRNAFC